MKITIEGNKKEIAAFVNRIQRQHEKENYTLVREPYQRSYSLTKEKEPMEWRRFELLTENDAERERLERVLEEHELSRKDLAIILLGLRVRPEFGKKDFGI